MIYFMIYLRNKRIWIYRNIKQNRMKSIDNQVWAGVVMSLLHRQLPPNRNWGVTGFVCILRLLDVTGQVRDCPCLCNYFLVQTSYCFTAHNYTCYRLHQLNNWGKQVFGCDRLSESYMRCTGSCIELSSRL